MAIVSAVRPPKWAVGRNSESISAPKPRPSTAQVKITSRPVSASARATAASPVWPSARASRRAWSTWIVSSSMMPRFTLATITVTTSRGIEAAPIAPSISSTATPFGTSATAASRSERSSSQ